MNCWRLNRRSNLCATPLRSVPETAEINKPPASGLAEGQVFNTLEARNRANLHPLPPLICASWVAERAVTAARVHPVLLDEIVPSPQGHIVLGAVGAGGRP